MWVRLSIDIATRPAKRCERNSRWTLLRRQAAARCYVQVAQGIDDEGKREQEIGSLLRVRDSFKKVVLVRDHIVPWFDEHGIQYMGMRDFLMDERSSER